MVAGRLIVGFILGVDSFLRCILVGYFVNAKLGSVEYWSMLQPVEFPLTVSHVVV